MNKGFCITISTPEAEFSYEMSSKTSPDDALHNMEKYLSVVGFTIVKNESIKDVTRGSDVEGS